MALNGAGAEQAVTVCKRGGLYGYDLSSLNYGAQVTVSDTAGALDSGGAPTVDAPIGRVAGDTDADDTKYLYVDADWIKANS
jgi:hypothetical protein